MWTELVLFLGLLVIGTLALLILGLLSVRFSRLYAPVRELLVPLLSLWLLPRLFRLGVRPIRLLLLFLATVVPCVSLFVSILIVVLVAHDFAVTSDSKKRVR